MAKENKEFLDFLNKFYGQGLLKEVFRSKRAIVCNVFNQFYMAFPLEIIADMSEKFPAFIMNSTGLKQIVEDDRFVLQYYKYLSEADRDRILAVFDENLMQHWLKKKSEFEQRPPQKNMDLEYERQLLENGPPPKEASKQSFFRRLKDKLFSML